MSVTSQKSGVFRVGVLGATRQSLFQIESLEQLPEVECARVEAIDALNGRFDALVVTDACDAALESARHAVNAGRHVLLIPPLHLSAGQLAELSAEQSRDAAAEHRQSSPGSGTVVARHHERDVTPSTRISGTVSGRGQLLVWRPLRNDADARAARQVARAVETGALRSIHYTLHEMAADLLPATSQSIGRAVIAGSRHREARPDVLNGFLEPRLDLLLGMTSVPVRRVFARCRRSLPDFSTSVDSVQASGSNCAEIAACTACLAVLEFGDGLIAQLDLDLAATARQAPGWTLQGSRGGYAGGRQFCSATDGELFDVPVETLPVDPYTELLSALRGQPSPTSDGEWVRTGAVAVQTAELVAAIGESSETGFPVVL